jgi:hypothetical protein
MTSDDLLAQLCDLLKCQGPVSYWVLQRRFDRSDLVTHYGAANAGKRMV